MSARPLVVVILLIAMLGCDAGPVPGDDPGRTPGSSSSPASRTPGWTPFPLDARRTAIAAARLTLIQTLPAHEISDLTTLYSRVDDLPVWADEAGQVSPEADAAIALLENARSDGLPPDDYRASELLALRRGLNEGSPLAEMARADVLLSASTLRYLRHLHLGRVDPRGLGLQLVIPGDRHDFPEILRSAIERGTLEKEAAALSPPFAQYQALKAVLARYRALAAKPRAPLTLDATVRRGDTWTGVRALRDLLVVLGDMPAETPRPISDVYDDELATGVVRFQQRHGLEPDGTVGRATADALRVPLSWRTRQIELALERLRWLPDFTGRRVIVVNIPMFRLWAWDAVPSSDPPALDMAVIVGRALDTRTPVFAQQMSHVIFRPYWNVPASILRTEILPSIRRDPRYLDREDMEIVRGQMDTSPVVPLTPEHLTELGRGDLRVRQRPGPRNALGLVKFMFPNQNDVYLHGTPAAQLFRHARRDFSHGCIRVENPVRLAEWVLARESGWERNSIDAAMEGAPNRRVNLTEPVEVVIFYTTAAAMPADGAVHFADDLYGHDRILDHAW